MDDELLNKEFNGKSSSVVSPMLGNIFENKFIFF